MVRDDPAPIYVPPALVLGMETPEPGEDLRDELGFTAADVTAAAEVVSSGTRFAVLTGDVGEEALDRAGAEPDDDGVVTLDDHEHAAADGDQLAVGSESADVAAWVADGDRPTLADDDAVVAVAAALDEADPLSAVVTTLVSRDAGYDAVGLGWSVDDDEPRQVIAYAFPDEEAAEDGAARIESAFAGEAIGEILELDEAEVDGTVVRAHVRPGPDGDARSPRAALEQDLPIFSLDEG